MPCMTPPRPRRGRVALLALGLPLAALLVATALLLALLPARAPLVARTDAVAPRDVERALQLLRQHDPRRAIPGVVRVLALSQHEADLLLNLAAARVHPGRWSLAFGADRLQLQASLRLPDNPLGTWLNLELQARPTAALPRLESARLGRLPLPVPLVEWLLEHVVEQQGLGGWLAVGAMAVQQVRLLPQRIDIVYAWGPEAPARVIASLLPAPEQARLQAYVQRLGELAGAKPAGAPRPLSAVLPPLFELARSRSAAGADPALENRAALMALAMAASGVGLGALRPPGQAGPAPRLHLTLAGRIDFPQHYLASATLAAESGSPLADVVGLYKELADARGGSGFSFNDVAANRAGTRLGELAVTAPALVQQRLSTPLRDQDLLPDVSDLPEFLSAADFRRRFGAPGSPPYERLMREIEARLAGMPLYQAAR